MNLITLTQALRNQIMENYYKYKKEFFNNYTETDDELGDEENIFDDEIELIEYDNEEPEDEDDDEYIEELYSIYDEQVISKVINDIKSSGYKKIIYFIILSDCLEYIKSEVVKGKSISNDEKYLLILLENFDSRKLLNIIDKENEFLLDIMTIFLEYNMVCTNDEKYKNRSILKKQTPKISKQFKLSILDDLQEYYDKNK